jgi:hypothetical protein
MFCLRKKNNIPDFFKISGTLIVKIAFKVLLVICKNYLHLYFYSGNKAVNTKLSNFDLCTFYMRLRWATGGMDG